MKTILVILSDLMTWWSVAVISLSALVCIGVVLREPWSSRGNLILCPMCSREMHQDWFTPRGCCCDCDEELHATAHPQSPSLTRLNPRLLWIAGWKHVPDSSHATDAPACAGPRPSQRFYVW